MLDPASVEALPWRDWRLRHFSAYTTAPMGVRHERVWDWFAGLRRDVYPRPLVEVWPRGGAKSTTIEGCTAYLGSQPYPQRRYALYVCETQEQANKHVGAIGTIFEAVGVQRAVNQYGASRGWTRTEIRTATGFNVSAFGLDAGMRGIKLDQYRPDIIIFDDIDGRHDTPATVQKKIETITTTILPAGSSDVAVIVVQNKVHADSIVSRLADGRADFLHDRIPATVEPAVEGLEYVQEIEPDGSVRYRITGGTSTWAGQDLVTCENQINKWGITAFEREAQHNVATVDGGLWDLVRDIAPFRVTMIPDLERIVVAIDPNTTAGNDAAGIAVAGIAHRVYDPALSTFKLSDRPHGYVLEDVTTEGGPKGWAEAAVSAYHKYRADNLLAERNNGGDMVAITVSTIPGAPEVELVWASRGKHTRAEPVQKLYEDGRVHHVGTFPAMEAEMCTWRPGANADSPNRMDALVWALTDLMLENDGDLSALHDYMNRQLGRA